jgi:hypothetical protein
MDSHRKSEWAVGCYYSQIRVSTEQVMENLFVVVVMVLEAIEVTAKMLAKCK